MLQEFHVFAFMLHFIRGPWVLLVTWVNAVWLLQCIFMCITITRLMKSFLLFMEFIPKKLSLKFFFWKLLHNIRWHNWANLKYEKDNQSKWNHSSLHKIKLCHDTRTPDPGAMKLIVFEEALSLITNVYFSSYAWYSGAKIFKELLLSFRIPHFAKGSEKF